MLSNKIYITFKKANVIVYTKMLFLILIALLF